MKRRLFGCLVLTGVIWCLISGMAGIKGVSPVVSDNVGAQNYDGGTARPVRSYLRTRGVYDTGGVCGGSHYRGGVQ